MDAENFDGAALRRLAGDDPADRMSDRTAGELAQVLAAAAGPCGADPEGEEQAVAMFHAARVKGATRRRRARPVPPLRWWVRRLGAAPSTAVAVVASVVLGSGIALAGVGVPLLPPDQEHPPQQPGSVRSTPAPPPSPTDPPSDTRRSGEPPPGSATGSPSSSDGERRAREEAAVEDGGPEGGGTGATDVPQPPPREAATQDPTHQEGGSRDHEDQDENQDENRTGGSPDTSELPRPGSSTRDRTGDRDEVQYPERSADTSGDDEQAADSTAAYPQGARTTAPDDDGGWDDGGWDDGGTGRHRDRR
ncbi:hypothetical protein AQ490_03965 [Wenjunlia vitaminophila]|uniref:Uncharacterized protein n=1 Tax=Wenjunlia vitaminophila TaxID=76728 RepID=A0A0T6LR03_WENVI|nr:hypothetical protein [Wenjunlia vitaminophila]KRV48420.1 hypothetical protein AQ490_03965 [Wenjunlia vitaminophila]